MYSRIFCFTHFNYSFDVRGRAFSKALYWSDTNAFGPRAYFLTVSRPATLSVDNVQLDDEGVSWNFIHACKLSWRENVICISVTHAYAEYWIFSCSRPPHCMSFYENVLQSHFLICYRCIVVVLIFKILQREIIE